MCVERDVHFSLFTIPLYTQSRLPIRLPVFDCVIEIAKKSCCCIEISPLIFINRNNNNKRRKNLPCSYQSCIFFIFFVWTIYVLFETHTYSNQRSTFGCSILFILLVHPILFILLVIQNVLLRSRSTRTATMAST